MSGVADLHGVLFVDLRRGVERGAEPGIERRGHRTECVTVKFHLQILSKFLSVRDYAETDVADFDRHKAVENAADHASDELVRAADKSDRLIVYDIAELTEVVTCNGFRACAVLE